MKLFTTVLGFLAVATPVICDPTCSADDVLVSLTTDNHYADEMQSDVDNTNESIDPSGSVYKNFRKILGHLNDDLKCTVNASQDEQTQICGAFVTFAKAQLRYLHVADGLQFFQANGHGENAVKMRGYIQQYKKGLEGYKNRVRAAVPTCADKIALAYSPISEQFDDLLQEYSAGGQSDAQPGPQSVSL